MCLWEEFQTQCCGKCVLPHIEEMRRSRNQFNLVAKPANKTHRGAPERRMRRICDNGAAHFPAHRAKSGLLGQGQSISAESYQTQNSSMYKPLVESASRRPELRIAEYLLTRDPQPSTETQEPPGDIITAGTLADAVKEALDVPVSRYLVVTAAGPSYGETPARVLAEAIELQTRPDEITYEHFLAENAPPDAYDAILFLDPPWGRCAFRALSQAHRQLRKGGILVYAGLARTAPLSDDRDKGTAVLPYLESQAQRCGFRAQEPRDFSPTARKAFRDPLRDPLHSKDIESALRALSPANAACIVAGFHKAAAPRWTIRAMEPGDADAMRALFAEVFSPNTMSAAHWQWKYGDGRGRGTAAWYQGEMVAFYGGLPRPISYKGRPDTAMQITDVMVKASERGVLRREGAFFLAAASFPECYVGYGAEALIGYGFPTARHQKVAELLKLYSAAGKIHELSWPARPAGRSWRFHIETLGSADLPAYAHDIDRLWQAMGRSLADAIVGVRNWAFIRHRFVDHPDKAYEHFLVRRRLTRRPVALLVLAREGEICHLRDFVGDIRLLDSAIRLLRGVTAAQGMKILKTWITDSFAQAFPADERQDQELDIFVPHSIWTHGPETADIRGRWWLMGGDTDFL